MMTTTNDVTSTANSGAIWTMPAAITSMSLAFTHLDRDHFARSTEFFYLEHAKKYQSGDRIKMNVMWVPAAVITEKAPDDEEARVLQKEARHRFKEGSHIRIFSRPERLRKWCEQNGIKLEDRLDLVTDAAKLCPSSPYRLTESSSSYTLRSQYGRTTILSRTGMGTGLSCKQTSRSAT